MYKSNFVFIYIVYLQNDGVHSHGNYGERISAFHLRHLNESPNFVHSRHSDCRLGHRVHCPSPHHIQPLLWMQLALPLAALPCS